MRGVFLRILIVCAVLATSASSFEAHAFDNADRERQRWIQKVARALRGGRAEVDPKVREELLKKTDAEVIDYFLARKEFGDTVLDFNIFFLGFRTERIRMADGELADAVYDFPAAIRSAREVLKGGDFFTLLDLEQPLYQGRLNRAFPLDPADEGKPVDEIRAKHFIKIQQGLRDRIAFLRANPTTPIERSCAVFLDEVRDGWIIGNTGINLGTMDIGFKTNIWYGRIVEACTSTVRPASFDFAAELELIYKTNEKLFPALADFEPKNYSTRDLLAVRTLDPKAIGLSARWNTFGNIFRHALQNSSTNMNRKRGAYVLSRFFCDDLTPINVEAPSQHTGGAHGSDPSCFACHYKLDPMSGFFRDFGKHFGDYVNGDKIRFDDNAVGSVSDYVKAWQSPEGAKRKWNVGYVRSTSREELNTYGESIEDMFRMLRSEPEVKRCIVKRLFEYYVSDQQAFDGGYHEYLTSIFAREAQTSSTKALKEVTKQILLSRSFREPDPVAANCYDFPPGYDPAGKPPCQVAHVVKKNCVTCHQSVANFPYLDLSTWKQMPDGSYNFPHQTKTGEAIPTKVTFGRILERLTTEDVKKRMPLRRHMDALERETLFRWTNEILTQGSAFFMPLAMKKQENKCPLVR